MFDLKEYVDKELQGLMIEHVKKQKEKEERSARLAKELTEKEEIVRRIHKEIVHTYKFSTTDGIILIGDKNILLYVGYRLSFAAYAYYFKVNGKENGPYDLEDFQKALAPIIANVIFDKNEM